MFRVSATDTLVFALVAGVASVFTSTTISSDP